MTLTRRKSLFPDDLDSLERIVLNHGRDHPVPALELIGHPGPLFTSEQDLPSFLLGLLDGGLISFKSELRVQRSDERARVFWRTHPLGGRGEGIDEGFEESLRDALVNEQSTGGRASLASGSEGSEEDASKREVLVGIGKNDSGLQ